MNSDPCICGRLRRTARALTRRYDEALAPAGMTVTQFSILRTLSRLEAPTLAELARATAHEKSGLWRLVQPLVGRGWIAGDGKARPRLALTQAGATALADAEPHWLTAQADIHETLGERGAALVDLLSELEAHA